MHCLRKCCCFVGFIVGGSIAMRDMYCRKNYFWRMHCQRNITHMIYYTLYSFYIAPIYYYTFFQSSVCWFSYVVALFWQITFPFHARMCKKQGKMKLIYAAVMVLAFFVTTSSSDYGVCNGRLCDQSDHISVLHSKEWICFVLLLQPSS